MRLYIDPTHGLENRKVHISSDHLFSSSCASFAVRTRSERDTWYDRLGAAHQITYSWNHCSVGTYAINIPCGGLWSRPDIECTTIALPLWSDHRIECHNIRGHQRQGVMMNITWDEYFVLLGDKQNVMNKRRPINRHTHSIIAVDRTYVAGILIWESTKHSMDLYSIKILILNSS